jgi:hypothetical protein
MCYYRVVTSHQVMDTFIKLILIICFKLHAGMVAVLQMLKDLQSSNSDTTYYLIPSVLAAFLLATRSCVQSRTHLLTYV